MPLSHRLHRLVNSRMDARYVAAARIGVGAASAMKALLVWGTMERVLSPSRMRMPHFDWLPAPPPEVLPWFIAAWVAAGAAFAAGLCTRTAAVGLVACGAYVLSLDQQLYSNHLYLLCVLGLLLGVGNAGAAWSLDALSAPQAGSRTVERWPALLLMFQVSIVYGFAAVTKLNPQYLSGAILSVNVRREGWGAMPEVLHTAEWMGGLALASILVETFLALGLWLGRLRPATMVLGVGFHLSIVFFMRSGLRLELVVFALQMLAIYPLFLARDDRPPG